MSEVSKSHLWKETRARIRATEPSIERMVLNAIKKAHAHAQNTPEQQFSLMRPSILAGFMWHLTPQGEGFWDRIYWTLYPRGSGHLALHSDD
jgi:hypothetical protein